MTTMTMTNMRTTMTDNGVFNEKQSDSMTHTSPSRRGNEMTTTNQETTSSSNDRAQRLADLRASRPSMATPSMNTPKSVAVDSTHSSSVATAKRRATLGKIFATGLTSTTVFGLTAALGFASAQGSTGSDVVPQIQYILDVATGQLVTYTNGQPTAATQVMSPAVAGQAVAGQAAVVPVATTPLNLGGQSTAAVVAAPAAGANSATPSQPATTPGVVPVVETVAAPVVAAPVIAIPIAIPTPAVTVPAPQGNSSGTQG
jgi:hypothetical protein